ncbi:MAG: hypothetical protein ABR582_14735, partial [Gemmatimonadaceae bacterium]
SQVSRRPSEHGSGNAVKIGNRWYSMDAAPPWGNLMAFGANLYYNLHNSELSTSDALAATAGGVGQTLAEQPFLQGTRELADGLRDQKSVGRFARNMAGSFVPQIAARAAQAADPTVREVRTFGDAVNVRIPGLSQTVAPRIDQLGRETQRDADPSTRLVVSLLDPGSRAASADPLAREITRVGATVSRLTKRKDETADQFEARQRAVGSLLQSVLTDLIESDGYKKAKAEEQRDLIESTTRRMRAAYSRSQKRGGVSPGNRDEMEVAGHQLLK